MIVDVKCMSNGVETAMRVIPAHRSSSGIIVNMWQLNDIYAPVYSILFGVLKIQIYEFNTFVP